MAAGGDDYELAFTAPPGNRQKIEALGTQLGLRVTRIGSASGARADVSLRDKEGVAIALPRGGFDHFA
jgi:thiamine-monophosphate kinase